jgi:hypothetical protein
VIKKALIPLALLCLAASYPDPKLTPGDIVTEKAAVVCKAGYSKTVRHVTAAKRKEVLKEYHAKPGHYECDHRISLELGGSNDIKNLWPEDYPQATHKDFVENYLHRQVCAGSMSLQEAQFLIVNKWEEIYEKTFKASRR